MMRVASHFDDQAAHQSVLRIEALAALNVRADGVYVDGTFGRGGHARLILARLDKNGRLIVLDQDPAAIAVALELFADDQRVTVIHARFSRLRHELEKRGLAGEVDGILLDLGVSSPQLDEAARGFSFQHDGPLDMRMDSSQGQTAAQWLAEVEEAELARVLKVYGEEKFAKRIARAIVAQRAESPVTSTAQLAELVHAAMPFVEPHKKHPATRSFQAIRIAVNNELGEIEAVLPDALDALKVGGRLVVISFHSLEDRLVKRYFQKEAKGDDFPPDLPVRADQIQPRIGLVGKPRKASNKEIEKNRRARSAVMRTAERLR